MREKILDELILSLEPRWRRIVLQLNQLLSPSYDELARRATTAALLHHKVPGVSWTGFYTLRGGELLVEVYQGPLACIRLAPHQGVCWAAVDREETVIVPDVADFEGHVPCDARTRSEIVLPLRNREGKIIGVLLNGRSGPVVAPLTKDER